MKRTIESENKYFRQLPGGYWEILGRTRKFPTNSGRFLINSENFPTNFRGFSKNSRKYLTYSEKFPTSFATLSRSFGSSLQVPGTFQEINPGFWHIVGKIDHPHRTRYMSNLWTCFSVLKISKKSAIVTFRSTGVLKLKLNSNNRTIKLAIINTGGKWTKQQNVFVYMKMNNYFPFISV